MSDALCRLATGASFTTRELYTDASEVIFKAQRPCILNGIEEVATRGDLLDRALILYLPRIPENKRRVEREFWDEFENARPRIFGALLDATVIGLQRLPNTRLSSAPRLADFATWATAAETGLGFTDGAFMEAYSRNKAASNDIVLEASPLILPLTRLLESRDWEGTATALLDELESASMDDQAKRKPGWPKSPARLSGELRRLAPNLRKAGIEVEHSKKSDRNKTRVIRIWSPGRETSVNQATGEMTRPSAAAEQPVEYPEA